jgi:hypothetical protein
MTPLPNNGISYDIQLIHPALVSLQIAHRFSPHQPTKHDLLQRQAWLSFASSVRAHKCFLNIRFLSISASFFFNLCLLK